MKCPHCSKKPLFWRRWVEHNDNWLRTESAWDSFADPFKIDSAVRVALDKLNVTFYECSNCGGTIS